MPDPKPKKSLNDLVTEAGNEVLGQQEKLPSNNSMSDEELLTIFGGDEKKKSSPSDSPGLPPAPQKEEQTAELGQSYAPEKKSSPESGTGSLNQSSKAEDNGIGIANSALSKLNQRLLDFPAQLLETSAILGSQMEKIAPTGEGPTDPQQSYMYKSAQKYRDWIKEIYPTNAKVEQDDPYYIQTIAGSTGDLLALVATGATSRGSQALNQIAQASIKTGIAPLVTGAAKNYVTNPSVLTGAMQMGTAEWEQAKQQGATDDQAFEVFYKNATVGSLMESIPVMQFFKRLDNVTGGGVKNAIKTGATQGLEEMTTEVAQQYYSNYTASQTYDATRKWFDGMKESGGIGFGMGFVLGSMGVSLRKRQETAQTPEEKAEIQKALDLVNEKASEMKNGTLTDQGEVVTPENTQEPIPGTEEAITETIPAEEDVVDVEAEVLPNGAPGELVQETVAEDINQVPPTQEVIQENSTEPIVESEVLSEEQLTPTQETIDTAAPEETVAQTDQPVSQEPTINIEEKTISATPKSTKVLVGKNNYQVKIKDGELLIRNKDNKKKINPNSAQGKKIIEAYKSKSIQKFSQGKTAEITPEMTDEDYVSSVISTSENPSEIAMVWNDQPAESISGKEQVIKDSLRRTPIENIYQFGDRNNVSKNTILNYASKKGTPIDVQAQEMANTSGLDITPQDIVDFIQKYPNGKNTARPKDSVRQELETKFKKVTGLELTPEFASQIAKFENDYKKLKENKYISTEEITDEVFKGEDISKFRFLFDSDEDYTNALRYVKQKVRADLQSGRSVTTQTNSSESESSSGTSEESQEVVEGSGSETEVSRTVRSLTNKVGSLRNAQSDSERKRLAEEIIKEADGYLLNREGIMVANDGSFALPNGKTFFDLLDQGKSVYYLDPDAKIARDIFDYNIIANELTEEQRQEVMDIISDGEAIPFDDAFRLGVIDKAKEMGYDGVLMKEIDGTDSTIQILNTDAITLVHGEEMVNKQPKEDAINTRSDAQVSINANKGKTDINDMMGITMFSNNIFGININDITRYTKKGKEFFQKWLTSNGFIPENVFKSWLNTEGQINSELSKMKYYVADFRRAVKEGYKVPLGKDISVGTKAEINSALSGNKESMANLPEEVQHTVSEMRQQIDYLSQRMIDEGIVTGELVGKLQENMGVYLFRSYRKHDDPDWVQDIDPQIVNRAKAYIQQQYPDYTTEEIDGVINELLYSPDAPMHLIKTGKLGSKDLSILKKRQDLPAEIRALYGEYSDPLVNYSKSVMKMINIIEKHKFLEDVKKQGEGKFLFEKPTGNHSAKLAGDKSSTMAPLNGLYTTPEIAQAFEEFNSAPNIPTWMEYYMKAISTVKAAKTVFNLTTHARNVLGNLAFVVANGHYNFTKGADAFRTIKTDLTSGDNDKFREAYQHYQKLGIVGDSGSASELKKMLEDAKMKPDKFDYVNQNMIKKTAKATAEAIGDLYAAEDDFYKIYAFENEYSRYKEAYGDTKTDAEIEQIAADIVKNTYPTYSKTNKLIKEMRKAPILGTFISFPAEVIRTTFNTAEITKQELQSDNPKVRAIGAQRLAGQLISASLTASLSAFTKYLYGISDEEEEEIRKFVAPWSKDSVFFYTGPLKDGKANMIDLSQTDPHGFWQKPIIALLDGKDLKESTIAAAKDLFEPFVGLNMITEALIDAKSNKKTTGQEITNTSLPVGDQARDYASYFFDFTKPGTLNSVDRIYKGYKLNGQPDEYGKIYSFGNEALAAFGGQRISSMDIPKSYRFAVGGVHNEGGIKQQIAESKKIYTGYRKVEQPYMSESEKQEIKDGKEEALNKSVEALKKDLTKMKALYFGAQRLGVPAKELKGINKDLKLPSDLVKLVYSDLPLDKMKIPSWSKGRQVQLTVDEYLKKYLQKN